MGKNESKISQFIDALENYVRSELKQRFESYKPEFTNPEVFNVLTALVARQATLMIELISAPQIWNGHSAPLFLRAMTDVHITFSWIILEPEERSKQYIEHGLGQAVLMLEHRKQNLESANPDDKLELEMANKAEQDWIDAQKWHFMVDVNVGAWSGKTTRVMADEAGILPFYNYVYTPFSQCAHSTWYHVGRYNSRPSESPLSRLVWSAHIAESSSDVWNLHLAAKYLDKTFNLFDEKILKIEPQSKIRDWVNDEIQSRFQKKS